MLHRFRDGDAAAFADVMKTYGRLVRAVVSRRIHGSYAQEEAMQDVWVHIFGHRHAVDPERAESFPGWLATVAQRRCIDLLRRRGARPEDLAEDGNVPEVAVDPAQHVTFETKELRAAVDAFKGRLKPPWNQFFEMHFVQGLPYADVGETLGIGKLRCKYMKRVLAARAQRNQPLMVALGRWQHAGGHHAL